MNSKILWCFGFVVFITIIIISVVYYILESLKSYLIVLKEGICNLGEGIWTGVSFRKGSFDKQPPLIPPFQDMACPPPPKHTRGPILGLSILLGNFISRK